MNLKEIFFYGFLLVFLLFGTLFYISNFSTSFSSKPPKPPVQSSFITPLPFNTIDDKSLSNINPFLNSSTVLSNKNAEKLRLIRTLSARTEELKKKHQKLKELENELSKDKKILHLRILVITRDDIHDNTRVLVGSIHKFHPELKIIIFGLNLRPVSVGELKLWSHVEYHDLLDFLTSSKLYGNPSESNLPDTKFWVPLILHYSAKKYGKVLFIDSTFNLLGKINEVDEILEKEGSYFLNSANSDIQQYFDCDWRIQGYRYGSYAFKHYLAPQVLCGHTWCSEKQKALLSPVTRQKNLTTLLETHKNAFICHPFPKNLFGESSKNRPLSCEIFFRNDFLYSYAQLPKYPRKGKPKDDQRIYIGIGFPSTSKGVRFPSVDTIPPLAVLIPTFLKTIRKNDPKYFYNFYLGFDVQDSFYDSEANQKQIYSKFKEITNGHNNLEFHFIRCRPTYGWTTFLWNAIFQHAVYEGNDYFYQVNDDLRFITEGWTDAFVEKLQSNPVLSNFGVIGPLDVNNGNIFTQSFVHRTHYEIFGFFYPPVFKNWYSDDWITDVYSRHKGTFRMSTFKVHNSQVAGTRYHVCSEQGLRALANELAVGEKMELLYLKEKKKM